MRSPLCWATKRADVTNIYLASVRKRGRDGRESVALPLAPPVALRVEELMPILGIGRNTAYELVRSGRLRSIRVGRQVRIPKNALIEFLEDTEK